MDEPPSRAPTPPADLWGAILEAVSSSRAIPAKQILLLGEPGTGKSALAAALLQKPPPPAADDGARLDFALHYDWADVRDDADEDTLARLSVYEVPSSARAHTALVAKLLPPRAALPHTLAVVVLDWTKPWTFVDELETWLLWLDAWAQGDADGARETQIVREECRERLQAHLQRYTEPSAEPEPAPAAALAGADTLLPLGPGVLTHNAAGLPLLVVCAKADLIDDSPDAAAGGGMVKGKSDAWEERTDGVMQVLRTVCLKYGAALFYTTPTPATLAALRQYALHLLFLPPAGEAGRSPFPFGARANTLDRDRVLVPAGWDSWGKLAVLRDGFDARAWGAAWDADVAAAAAGSAEPDEPGARRLYAELVPDESVKPAPLPPFNEPMAEQAFLTRHYDDNAKKPDRDPRGAFRTPGDAPAGVVGPLGPASFSLPAVERALADMDGGAPAPAPPALERKRTATAGRAPLAAGPPRPGSAAGAGAPASPEPKTPASSQTQHEVLHNFFQSLLSKDRAGATAAVAKGAQAKSPSKSDATDAVE